LFQDQTQVLEKIMAVLVVRKYLTALNASRNDVVKRSLCVDA
jgi:hypothetical protein